MRAMTVSEMRSVEEKAFASGVTVLELMERAGKECAILIDTRLKTQDSKPAKKTVIIFCGPGNNGGDGFVCAKYLNLKNQVYLVVPVEPKTGAARAKFFEAENKQVKIIPMQEASFIKPHIIVDALLGVGAKLPLRGEIKEACRLINSMNSFKVSIDIPSGMDADIGECDPDAVVPDATICIQAPKIGEVKAGKEKTGGIWIADIRL